MKKFINPEKELYKRGYEDAVSEGINKDYFDGIVTGETNLIKTLIKTYDIKELAQASQKSEKEILKMTGKQPYFPEKEYPQYSLLLKVYII